MDQEKQQNIKPAVLMWLRCPPEVATVILLVLKPVLKETMVGTADIWDYGKGAWI